jgi:hypothetical protein
MDASIRTAVFIAVVWSACLPKLGLTAVSTAEFLAQYEPAAIRLIAFYNHATMSGRYIQTFKVRGSETESRLGYQFTIYSDGKRLRTDLRQIEGKSNRPALSASVVAPERSFVVDREDEARPYVLQRLKRKDEGPPDGRAVKMHLYAAFCPYADTDGVTILDRLKDAATTITGINEEERGGESLVTVSARFQLRPPTPRVKPQPEWNGTFTFAKSKGWALQESTRSPVGSNEVRISCNVTYSDVIEGIPVLKRGEFWRDTPNDRLRIADCEVEEFKPGPPPPRDFTLAAFGIRDIGVDDGVTETNYWLYLAIGGIILIAAALVLAQFTSRKRLSGDRGSA